MTSPTISANNHHLDRLIAEGLVSERAAAAALEIATRQNRQVLEVLVEAGEVSRTVLVRSAAETAGLQFVDLVDYQIDNAAVVTLSGEQARANRALPLGFDTDGALLVAVTIKTSQNIVLRDDLTRMTHRQVRFVVAEKADIENKMNQVYRAESEFGDLVDDIDTGPAEDTLAADATDDAPIVRLVNLILRQAITDRASDIHIEPTERDLRVRYRIDGVLKETTRVARGMMAPVISRIKIMSEINIAEKRIPQDGRLSVNHEGKKIDMRVATLPTVWGEKVVMRILDNSNTTLELADLGFRTDNFVRFEKSYRKPYGMILVTGPTGSGKSTTLYAALNQVSKPEVNVITVEDPVEYRLPGINQVQVNSKAGLTFSAALRSILRSDPDIVLLGEIRDHETAQIAIEAALTGHLVLSTLHTNDAPSAITRLIEMGIEPFLVGSALDVVLAQRLCRTLCKKCKKQYTPEPQALINVGFPWEPGTELPTLFQPIGCNACANTGFKGRMALHEVMSVSPEIERLTVDRASADAINRVATEQGMEALRSDGWAKVLDGKTSIEEILRVVA